MQTSIAHPVDYLVAGHITQDLVEGGVMLGGTASYASLTAHSLGQQTALVTSAPKWLALPELKAISIFRKPSQYATTFENIETNGKRQQFVHHCAANLGPDDIPDEFRNAKIIHLGPVAGEISPSIIGIFPNAFLGITPQGWMRVWGANGKVNYRNWPNADKLLERANAVVFSIDDLQGNTTLIQEYAQITRVLAVTEGEKGASIYWNGDVHHISAPKMDVEDPTGAGDIFAAVFFTRLFATKNPWEAGEQAVKLASHSVARIGLSGIPTKDEIQSSQVEIVRG